MGSGDSSRPILVTGGTGQVGFELNRELAVHGHVISPTHDELDLFSPDSIRQFMRMARPRMVVNAGAYTAVDRAESEPDTARQVNADAPALLAEEAKRVGAAIIHFSTDYVFDGSQSGAYVETDSTNPLSVYGRTKLEGEKGVAESADAYIILRCSWVYSNRGSNFLKTMLRLGAERPEVAVVNDQAGSPSWARDIARATAAVVAQGVDSLRTHTGIYHLTAPDHTTWFEFARAIFQRIPAIHTQVRPITTAEYPTPARRPHNSVLDSSKIASTFGIQMPAWETQLDECLTSIQ